jgi:uncharacterized protein
MRTSMHRPPSHRPLLDTIEAAALRDLAIFPLPNAVLLPGGLLPLHVFEPRYREMTRDCLAGSRVMAIAMLAPGYETGYHGRPPIHPLCGAGSILCSEELPDGRFHLVLRGLSRIRIDHELAPDKSYRRARASLVDGAASLRPDVVPGLHRQLIALCDRLAMALDGGGAQLCELVHSQPTAAACVDVVAATLVTDPRLRQAFLDTIDCADRFDAAIDLVGRILCHLLPDGGTVN